MSAEVKRPDRVGRALHDELAAMIQSELNDPRVANVIVSRVRVSADLRLARVNVRLLSGSEIDEKAKKLALAGLASAAGFLRKEATLRLGLRFAPELVFHYDDGRDAATRVEALLEEVHHEEKKSRGK